MVGSPQPHAHPWLQLLSQAFQNLAGASFCSTATHPAPGWTPAELCIYLFLHFPSFPRTLVLGRGGGKLKLAPKANPKRMGRGGGGSSSLHSPEARRKPGSVGLAGKRVGAGGRKGGGRQHRPPPLLGEIKNSHVQRVAASAAKSMLSRGSCKLFAAPGNQHLSLQTPPPPAPSSPRQKLPLPFSNPHMSCQQSMNRGSLLGREGGTRFEFWSGFVAAFISSPSSELSPRVLQHQIAPVRPGYLMPLSRDRTFSEIRDGPATGTLLLLGIPLHNS